MNAMPWDETPVGECTRDPDRWTTTADDEANKLLKREYSEGFEVPQLA